MDAEAPQPSRTLFLFLSILVTLEIFAHWLIISKLNVHWDEFHFLSQIYEAERAELSAHLQTFHVRLFSWLTNVPGQEVEQIVAGREFMFFVHLLVLWCLHLDLREFGRVALVFTILAYASLSEVFVHSASLRTDPLLALAFVGSLVLSRNPRPIAFCLTGALFALAMMLNLKAGLFLVLLYLFALLRKGVSVRQLALSLACFVTLFSTLYFFHRANLAPSQLSVPSSTFRSLIQAFLLRGVSEAGIKSFLASLHDSPCFWIFFCAGLYGMLRKPRRHEPWQFLALSFFPLMLLYRNAWPYFVPLAILGALYPFCALACSLQRLRGGEVFIGSAALLLFLNAAWNVLQLANDETLEQRAVLREVHRLFPTPVPYLDRCGMVSSFPMVGPFVSKWQLEKYAREGRRFYTGPVSGKEPEFFLWNFDLEKFGNYGLSESDRNFLALSFPYCDGPICLRHQASAEALSPKPNELFRY